MQIQGAVQSSIEPVSVHDTLLMPVVHESAATTLIKYDQFIDCLICDISHAQEGDFIFGRSFLFETGDSAERLVEAYRQALRRGAFLQLEVDGSLVSLASRLAESSDTAVQDLELLARANSGHAGLVRSRTGDHSKVHLVLHRGGMHRGYFGGMNIGDRFSSWDDLMLRIENDEDVLAMARACGLHTPGLFEPIGASKGLHWQFYATLPAESNSMFTSRGVSEGLEDFFGCATAKHFLVVMPYIDQYGSRLLEIPLDRGIGVTVLTPEIPNVYGQANRRTLARLSEKYDDQLEVRWLPGMCHAKFVQRLNTDGSRTFAGGSANLKRRSINSLGELIGISSEPNFNNAVAAYTFALARQAKKMVMPLNYRRLQAHIEDFLG